MAASPFRGRRAGPVAGGEGATPGIGAAATGAAMPGADDASVDAAACRAHKRGGEGAEAEVRSVTFFARSWKRSGPVDVEVLTLSSAGFSAARRRDRAALSSIVEHAAPAMSVRAVGGFHDELVGT